MDSLFLDANRVSHAFDALDQLCAFTCKTYTTTRIIAIPRLILRISAAEIVRKSNGRCLSGFALQSGIVSALQRCKERRWEQRRENAGPHGGIRRRCDIQNPCGFDVPNEKKGMIDVGMMRLKHLMLDLAALH